MRFLAALIFALALSGCGFHLRGAESARLPYKTIFIALPDTAEVNIWLQRYLQANRSAEITNDPKLAEAIFQQVADNRQKTILSVDAQGRVREFRMQMDYTFRVINGKGQELVKPNEINLWRDVTFDDSNILAKNLEEGLLWRDMTNELVSQILRRLATIKPRNPDEYDELN